MHKYISVSRSTDKSGGQHSEEEKIRCMVKDIERLKWSLIEKDQEAADRQRRGSVRLKKSRSLEDDATPEGRTQQLIVLVCTPPLTATLLSWTQTRNHRDENQLIICQKLISTGPLGCYS